MKMSMKLEGFEKLARQLKGMPDKLMRQTIAPAVKASTQVMADAMKRRVPQREGWIKKSIAVYSDTGKQYRKFKRFNPKMVVSYITGPIKPVVPAKAMQQNKRGRLSMGKIRPYWAIFVEKGTKGSYDIPRGGGLNKKVMARKGNLYGISGYNNAMYFRKGGGGTGWTFFGRKVKGKGQGPRPFVRPAFDENVKPTINRMRTELEKGVQKAMA